MANAIASEIRALSKDIEPAYERIKPHILQTPLMISQPLSTLAKANVFLKLESEQVTGSFKIRGAFNKILLLKEQNPEKIIKGLVAASSGNHAIACMHAGKTCGCSVEIFAREGMSKSKRDTFLFNGAKLTCFGKDCLDAEKKARQTAEERGQVYLSPYNDWDVMVGQGTIAFEIYNQLPEVDYILVSVGGGGGIGGIAAFFKNKYPEVQVIGCQARNTKVMYESIKAGHIVHEESFDTLSDGTSGDIEDGSLTFPICKTCVDDWILVDEKQISDAVFFMLDKHHKLIEGSAGVVIAALLNEKERFQGKNVVLLICGSNISSDTIKNILNDQLKSD